MYRCIIIDDEPHAIEGLKRYIDAMPELTLVESYVDPIAALKAIRAGDPVDFIFLDVNMPRINGIELSQEIRSKTDKLVFTTAHTKYAYQAFEASADAYLLKPYSLGKFVITVTKLCDDKFPIRGLYDDFFFVKSKEEDLKIVKIKYADLIAVESKQNYVLIHTVTKQVLTYMSLIEINKLLEHRPELMQLHRSFIVKNDQIESIDGNLIRMSNGLQITIGEHFRKDFNGFLFDRLIRTGKK